MRKSDRDRMITANLGLARMIAHRYKKVSPLPYEDLESLAFQGLIRAVDRYDPERRATENPDKTVSFSSYACPFIRGAILQHLRNQHFVKIPRTWQEAYSKGTKMLKSGTPLEDVLTALDLDAEEWEEITISNNQGVYEWQEKKHDQEYSGASADPDVPEYQELQDRLQELIRGMDSEEIKYLDQALPRKKSDRDVERVRELLSRLDRQL